MLKLLPFVQSFCMDLHQPGRGTELLFLMDSYALEAEAPSLFPLSRRVLIYPKWLKD
jgi:hypothetical protein